MKSLFDHTHPQHEGEEGLPQLSYWQHFTANARVARKSASAAVWHLAHAIVPCNLTSHEHWGVSWRDR